MIPYITKVITDFPERITGVASSPAADHLFKIRPPEEKIRPPEEARILPESQAIAFHHTTAQLLFLSRVCRDISKQRLLFSPLMSKPRMRMTGANSSAYSNTCWNTFSQTHPFR